MAEIYLDPKLDWHGLRLAMRRHWKVFMLVFLAVMAAITTYIILQPPVYEATARIMVNGQSRPVLPTEKEAPQSMSRDANIVDTQVEALYNIALARGVVAEMKLTRDPEFAVTYEGKPDQTGTAIALIDSLKIGRAGDTFLINLTAQSESRLKSARIANEYVQRHLALQIEQKRRSNRQASELLMERIDEMASEVERAERAVQNYKISNDLMSINGATLAEQSIAALDSELAQARAAERASHGRLQAANSFGARLGAAQTPALEGLLARQAAAEQQWQQARKLYGERHPLYQEARVRNEQLSRAVSRETGRARTSLTARRQQEIDDLRADASAASQRRSSLAKSVAATRDTLSATNQAQVRLNILERKAEAVRATYEAYLGRYQETSTALGTEQPDSRIEALATIPTHPVSPDRPLFLLVGSLFALLTALSATVLKSSMSARS